MNCKDGLAMTKITLDVRFFSGRQNLRHCEVWHSELKKFGCCGEPKQTKTQYGKNIK